MVQNLIPMKYARYDLKQVLKIMATYWIGIILVLRILILLKNGEIIHSGNAPYVDVNVLCGQTDVYSVVTRDQNGIELTSIPIEVSAITGSPTIPITQIATNVLSDSELELSWEVPAGLQPSNFIVYKKRNINDEYFEVDTTGTNSYIDIGTAFTTRNFLLLHSLY